MKKMKLMLVMGLMLVTLFNTNVLYAQETNHLKSFDKMIDSLQENNSLSLSLQESQQLDAGIQARVGYRVVTKSTNLNVRSGPGTNYSIIGRLSKGSIVDFGIFAAEKGYWWEITARDSYTGKDLHGWVDSRYLEYIPGSGT